MEAHYSIGKEQRHRQPLRIMFKLIHGTHVQLDDNFKLQNSTKET